MAFERYLRQRAESMKPAASLWKTGQIGINGAALRELGLEKMTHVVLFYDRGRKKIGLRFADSGREESAVKLVRRGKGAAVFARGFVKYYGEDITKARRFKLVRDEKQNLWVLEPE